MRSSRSPSLIGLSGRNIRLRNRNIGALYLEVAGGYAELIDRVSSVVPAGSATVPTISAVRYSVKNTTTNAVQTESLVIKPIDSIHERRNHGVQLILE